MKHGSTPTKRKANVMRALLDARGLEDHLARLLSAEGKAPFAFHLVSLCPHDLFSFRSPSCDVLEAGEVVAGLAGVGRGNNAVARLGPGKFAVVQRRRGALSRVAALADRISAKLSTLADAHSNELVCNVGTVELAEDCATPFQLMQCAETALDAEKARHSADPSPFGNATLKPGSRVRAVRRALCDALAQDQFELFYQPVVSTTTMATVQYEALIRWKHSSQKYISPDHFIPAAERVGIIADIDRWVLNKACMEILSHDGSVGVAVNLSPSEFLNSDVSATIERALEDTGLHPRRLTVELTENVFMSFSRHILRQFERIESMGVRLSLDDFGKAYSSLDRLYALPIKSIKIDRSLITPIARCARSRKIVSGIIKLAADLDLLTVAEGVEGEEQVDILRDAGATWLQGFHFGIPAPARIALDGQHTRHPDPCAIGEDWSGSGLSTAASADQPDRINRFV